ncbi:hypothetical protein Tco_0707875 [Tanacetum coccineum]
MNPIATQQAALDNALVPPEKRLKIEICNARIAFSKPQREETYQVTLEAPKLSPCYPAFLITAKVLKIYMHQFWNTIKKIKNTDAYNFKLDKKKCRVDTEVFHEILQICLILPNQEFVELPSKDDLVSFIKELDFMYQADNREISSARKEHMPYPRFTKVIIDHFISKDKTISMRNIINLHIIRDDSLLGTLKFVSKTYDTQKYGALIPDEMINQNIKDSKAYKTYYDFSIRKVEPKKARKFKKVASPSRKLSHVLEAEPVKKVKRVKRLANKSTTTPTASVVIRDTPSVSVSKKKAPAKGDRGKGMELLFDAALLEAAQVPDEPDDKKAGTDEETNTKPGVLDVPTYESENDDGNSDADDNERTDSDDDDENPSFTLKDYDEEEHDEEMTDANQNTKSLKQSSYVSSDFASKFLILENVPPAIDEVASMMNVKIHQEESSTQAPSLFIIHEMAIPETATTHTTNVPPTISMITPLPQLTTPSPAPNLNSFTS